MTLEERLGPFRADLEHELVALGGMTAGGHVDPRFTELFIAHQFATGGKRLRGLLPPALVTACGGELQPALVLGACIEAVHNGTLVHDDIQDRDTLRRGKPTLWTVVGVPQALNVGDALLIAPILRLLRIGVLTPPVALELADMLSAALLATIHGQVADVALRDAADVDFDRAMAVARAKTSPLFACALQGAAVLLELSAEARKAAAEVGDFIGIGFQIRDDLLDVIGTKGRGAAGADLREGKPTWPLIAACDGAPKAEVRELGELLQRAAADESPSDAEVRRWIAWIVARGGVDAARTALTDTLSNARVRAADAFGDAGAEVVSLLCDRLEIADG